MKRSLIPILLVLALLCVSLPGLAEGATVKFDKSANVVFEGEQLQTVLQRTGDAAEGEVTYQSSAPKVATVDANGIVTGLIKGETTITATVKTAKQTLKAKLNVTVARKATGVEVNTAKLPVFDPSDPAVAGLLKARADEAENALPVLLLPLKKTYELQASVLPKDATNRKILLTSDDDQVVRISEKQITGKTAGECILTVANQLTPEACQQYRILVFRPVSRIALTPSERSVAVGGQITVSADVTPADAAVKDVAWKSDSEGILTVDENGVVTGIKRGEARVVATAKDGSGVRANISVKVVQTAKEIQLSKNVLTVDVGKSAMLKATVLPANTDNKNVVWSSSNERIATVTTDGRVKGVSLGECQIICASKTDGSVTAAANIIVQQPVQKIVLDKELRIYIGDTAQLTWRIQPENATNKVLSFTSSAKKIVEVDQNGVITGLKRGEVYITCASTDGSERRARIKVVVMEHVTGVHMLRKTAYVSLGETAQAGAQLEPKTADNKNMTWVSMNPSIATASGSKTKVSIKGVANGETIIVGTTEDGGFQTSIDVKIGDWDRALQLTDARVRGADAYLTVKNRSSLNITSITAEVSVFDADGEPVPANRKDGSNTFHMVYNRALKPGGSTSEKYWKSNDFMLPDSPTTSTYVVKVTKYQIDKDWIKVIRKKYQPTKKCPVHV